MHILVPNQIIKTKVNATSFEHYKSKGYNPEINKSLEVSAEDLSHSSAKVVMVICDYCKKEITKEFQKYYKQRKFVKKDACFECFPLKQKDVCNYKYGVDSTLQLDESKKKTRVTNLRRYGVVNPMQNEEVKDRVKQTMLDNHGVEYAQQCEFIREKTKQTYMRNYGVEHPMYVKEIRAKVNNFEFVNGVRVSYHQKYLSELLDGALNLNVGGYFGDIALIDERIIVEYDGSGHNLSVQLGKISQEDFDKGEEIRLNTLLDNGWKCLTVVNTKERLFSEKSIKDIRQKIALLSDTSEEVLNYKMS